MAEIRAQDEEAPYGPPVPPGKCEICGHERMEVKPGYYACPGFYSSPMHYCCIFQAPCVTNEGKQHWMRVRLEEYCGCTLEEYLAARERLTESLLVEEVADA